MPVVTRFRPISGGTNNGYYYYYVDEETSDGDATRISGTVGTLYTFKFPNPVMAGAINGVTIGAMCKDLDVSDGETLYHGFATMALYSPGNVVKYGTSEMLLPSYVLKSYTWNLNPWTGVAWTWAELNALEIGVHLAGAHYNATYATAYCTQLYTDITHNPPSSGGRAQLVGPIW